MYTLAPIADLVNPTEITPVPVAIPPADDFDVRTDAEWEAMAEDSAALDAACSGHWAF